ncbi:polymorphic toxin type 15 domain-containing protein [Martelella mangrovi]|uniref:Novel toxin 15 domain-containing protein n=1 Tax=Martelella mangrovi TaxID=1397477 RepID=A0ABV2IHQ0_9HYPH
MLSSSANPVWTDTPREAIRDNARPKILSLTPDVCKTPIGSSTPPIPYCVVGYPDEAADNYTSSVFFTGQKAMVLRSNTTCCHGDDALHALDMVAGGLGDKIIRLGSRIVNRSLGAQWKTRVGKLDEYAEQAKKDGQKKMKVKLKEC